MDVESVVVSGFISGGSEARFTVMPSGSAVPGYRPPVAVALAEPLVEPLVDAGAPPQATRLSAKARASTSASAFFICFSPLLQFFRRHIISSEMIQLAKL